MFRDSSDLNPVTIPFPLPLPLPRRREFLGASSSNGLRISLRLGFSSTIVVNEGVGSDPF